MPCRAMTHSAQVRRNRNGRVYVEVGQEKRQEEALSEGLECQASFSEDGEFQVSGRLVQSFELATLCKKGRKMKEGGQLSGMCNGPGTTRARLS